MTAAELDREFDPRPDPCPPPVEPLPEFDPGLAPSRVARLPAWDTAARALHFAFHEAGHVVAGMAYAVVTGEGSAVVEDNGGKVVYTQTPPETPGFAPCTPEDQAVAVACASLYVAGVQCELLFRGFYERHGPIEDEGTGKHDYRIARRALREAGLMEPGWIWVAEGVARHHLTSRWDAVWLIAHHLYSRRRLDGPELNRLYQRATSPPQRASA